MALPFRTTGSLGPAFAPARLVRLAVKLACALARPARCPTALSEPSSSSVTLLEETAPVKLPTLHGPQPRQGGPVRAALTSGWYFKVGSTRAGALASSPPSYPTQTSAQSNAKLQ